VCCLLVPREDLGHISAVQHGDEVGRESTYSSHGQCARERTRHVVVILGLLWLGVGHDCRWEGVRHVIRGIGAKERRGAASRTQVGAAQVLLGGHRGAGGGRASGGVWVAEISTVVFCRVEMAGGVIWE
jgi:hypothetical protein